MVSVSWLQACIIFSAKDKNGIVWAVLQNFLKDTAKYKLAERVLSHMQGVFDSKANVKFELNGYENANSVIVSGLST
ncbi:MAG TPA: hypothetical protein PK289_12490 [Bacteroidia bacterium]|jgi:type III secretory pathway lipoprotein EscJ|nr:hypothetical protein [Bacteroidia bacterium]HRG52343.1 hypothetical protein [Bacteroidia bacterium]